MREPVEEPTEPLTDSERLLAAADVLDVQAAEAPPEATPTIAGTAALLRAMADDLEIGLYIVGAESPAAALALADDIRRYLK